MDESKMEALGLGPLLDLLQSLLSDQSSTQPQPEQAQTPNNALIPSHTNIEIRDAIQKAIKYIQEKQETDQENRVLRNIVADMSKQAEQGKNMEKSELPQQSTPTRSALMASPSSLSTSFSVHPSPSSNMDPLSESWTETDFLKKRYVECIKNMEKWTTVLRESTRDIDMDQSSEFDAALDQSFASQDSQKLENANISTAEIEDLQNQIMSRLESSLKLHVEHTRMVEIMAEGLRAAVLAKTEEHGTSEQALKTLDFAVQTDATYDQQDANIAAASEAELQDLRQRFSELENEVSRLVRENEALRANPIATAWDSDMLNQSGPISGSSVDISLDSTDPIFFRHRIRDLENKVDRLQRELAVKESKLVASVAAREELVKQYSEIEQKLLSSSRTNLAASKEIGSSSSAATRAVQLVLDGAEESLIAAMEKQMNFLESQVATLQNDLEASQSRAKEWEDRYNHLDDLIRNFRSKVAVAEAWLDKQQAVEAQLADLKASNENYHRLLDDATKHVDRHQAELDNLREQSRMALIREKELRKNLENCQNVLGVAEEERVLLKEYLVRYERELKSNEQKVRELGKVYERHEKELYMARQAAIERDGLQTQVRDLQRKLADCGQLEKDKQDLETKLESIQTTLVVLRREAAVNAIHNGKMEKKIQRLYDENQQLKAIQNRPSRPQTNASTTANVAEAVRQP